MTAKKKTDTRKIGRDAATGRFIPVKEAERRKKTAVVETIKRKKSSGSVSCEKHVHSTRGVSGTAIIKSLKIKGSDVKAARKLIKSDTDKTKKRIKK